jgi:long-chain acyl-CoA synthetase
VNIATIAEEAREQLSEPGTLIYVTGAEPDARHSTEDLHTDGVRFAVALRGLGLVPGERVAVLVPNCPEIGGVYHGILRSGCVALPILFLLAPAEVRHILADSGAAAVVTTPEFIPTVREATEGLAGLKHVISIGGGDDVLNFRSLVDAASGESPIEERDAEDLALMLYTSGTTGHPKGVMLTHGNLAFSSASAAEVALDNMKRLGLDPEQAGGITALPMAHAFGVIVSLVGARVAKLAGVRRGATSVMLKWFDAEQYLRCIAEYQCRTTAMVPTMMSYLCDHPAVQRYDTGSLNTVTSSAAPLPLDLLHRFEELFGCTVYESYGLTESAPIATSNRVESRKIGSVGVPFPGVDVAIKDPASGETLPATESGEVCIKGPNVMKGYWKLPEETEKSIRDGWLHTGDIGYLDPDGFLFIVDRVKNMIIRGGLNIYPRDVEEVLHRHPAVLEAAVVGVADEKMGEEVEAFVVLKSGAEATEAELLEHARASVAKYKSPKRIHFIDTLPKSGVGKILHRELREEAVRRR